MSSGEVVMAVLRFGAALLGADMDTYGPDEIPADDVYTDASGNTGYPKENGYDAYLKGEGGLSRNR